METPILNAMRRDGYVHGSPVPYGMREYIGKTREEICAEHVSVVDPGEFVRRSFENWNGDADDVYELEGFTTRISPMWTEVSVESDDGYVISLGVKARAALVDDLRDSLDRRIPAHMRGALDRRRTEEAETLERWEALQRCAPGKTIATFLEVWLDVGRDYGPNRPVPPVAWVALCADPSREFRLDRGSWGVFDGASDDEGTYGTFVSAAIALMGLINQHLDSTNVEAVVTEQRTNAAASPATRQRKGLPWVRLTVLKVRWGGRLIDPEPPAIATGTMPLHTVRQYYKHYGPEYGRGWFMGKVGWGGRFFVPQRLRGNPRRGRILKDYDLVGGPPNDS